MVQALASNQHRDRDLLVEEHIRLPDKIAHQLRLTLERFVPFDDLVASGRQGLLEAATRFDKTKDVKFKTFAEPRIRGAILDAARALSWCPRSEFKRPPEEKLNFWQDSRRTLDREEVSPEGDASECQSSNFLALTNEPPQEARIDLDRLRARVRAAVAELPVRERQIAERRYFSEQNFTEIREELGLSSKFYISRVHANAIHLLREKLSQDSTCPAGGAH